MLSSVITNAPSCPLIKYDDDDDDDNENDDESDAD